MLLTDITAEKLLSVAEVLGVGYLSLAATFPGSFPVDGEIYKPNNRLMINIVFRRRGRNTQAINVILSHRYWLTNIVSFEKGHECIDWTSCKSFT
jgi:hypothetical protein